MIKYYAKYREREMYSSVRIK